MIQTKRKNSSAINQARAKRARSDQSQAVEHDLIRAVSLLRRGASVRPTLGLILGSGFGAVLHEVKVQKAIAFSKIPGFFAPTVRGHEGRVILGTLAGQAVWALQGRCHYYEGYSLAQITFPVRVLAELGIQTIILTNAAGGINRKYEPGDFMSVRDHLNLMGQSPLRGIAGNCFVDLSRVYDSELGALFDRVAKRQRLRLHHGVYVAVPGPNYETPAEIRAFARLGADAVGMSTVPEAIMARYCGLRVGAISGIVNRAASSVGAPLSHAAVLAAGEAMAGAAGRFLAEVARNL